ncbi:MAG TPA: AI-2E family transporter [Thermodesulfobacteriota bacterium]|nr:AI-2E family transporter [Thermodesulfobacteriota bacterium]
MVENRPGRAWGKLAQQVITGGRAEIGLFILGILYTLYLARELLLPIFLALLIAAFLQPLVRSFGRARIPEPVGAGIIVLVFLGGVGLAVYELVPQAAGYIEKSPSLLRNAEYKLGTIVQSVRRAGEKTEQLENIAKGGEGKKDEKVAVKGPSVLERVFTKTWSFLGTGAIVVILVYFLLAQGRQTVLRLAGGLGGEVQGEKFTGIAVQIQEEIAAYIGTVALINLGVGAFTALSMMLLGMPQPLLLGAAATALNFIPYLGPGMTLLTLTAVSLTTFDSLLRILLPPLVFLIFTSLEGNVITPMILGSRLTLNPIMVFLSILFWGWVWGIPGIFLAVPILTALKIISENVDWLGALRLVLYPAEEKNGESP